MLHHNPCLERDPLLLPPAGKCTHTVQTKGENINLCWSPNGQAIAVGNKEDVITIIDTKSYKIVHEEQFKYEVRCRPGGGVGWGGGGGADTYCGYAYTADRFSFPGAVQKRKSIYKVCLLLDSCS